MAYSGGPSIKALVALAFSGSIGLLFLFLACALPQFNNWYPFTVIVFYLLSPIPTLISRRYSNDGDSSNPCKEFAWFITTGIVVSAFALPIVFTRCPVEVHNSTVTTTVSTLDVDGGDLSGDTTTTIPTPAVVVEGIIKGGACGLVITANAMMFLTIAGFFYAFDADDTEYSVW